MLFTLFSLHFSYTQPELLRADPLARASVSADAFARVRGPVPGFGLLAHDSGLTSALTVYFTRVDHWRHPGLIGNMLFFLAQGFGFQFGEQWRPF